MDKKQSRIKGRSSTLVHPFVVFVIVECSFGTVMPIVTDVFVFECSPFARVRSSPERWRQLGTVKLGLSRRRVVMVLLLLLLKVRRMRVRRVGKVRGQGGRVSSAAAIAKFLVLALKLFDLLSLQFDILEEISGERKTTTRPTSARPRELRDGELRERLVD